MAVCAPEGFRVSLAAEIVAVDEPASLDALNELHSRSLVEELDRSSRRYRIHALVRETAGAANVLRARHAEVIRKEFENWESDWRKCESDMADWQTAFTWLLGQSDESAWSDVKGFASTGFALTDRVGRMPEACEICVRMSKEADKRKDPGRLQIWYGNQALVLQTWGQFEETLELLKKQEAICIELAERESLQRSYCNQATTLWMMGRLEDAMALYRKQEVICVELGDRFALQASYSGQGIVLARQGRLEEAMALHQKEEAICLELGNRNGLQGSYNNQADILNQQGRLEEAMTLLKKQEAICLELGNRGGLQISYNNQALILKVWGQLEEAVALHEQEEAICLELGDKRNLAFCYANWGLLARKQGDRKTELEKLKQALVIFTKLKMPGGIKEVQDELDKTVGNA
jgi:tetratricopeptide (TPR) repeat protein